MTDIDRRSDGRVRFLPRREYENYLIAPDALAAVMSSLSGQEISAAAVKEWLLKNGGAKDYGASKSWEGSICSLEWLKHVRAAKLLTGLFADLTETREQYDKVEHSVMLTDHLLAHDDAHLVELLDYVGGLLAA